MTVAKKKTFSPPKQKQKPFMVYFKTADEHLRMKEAAAIQQRNPNPNLSEYARLAIRKMNERIMESAQ